MVWERSCVFHVLGIKTKCPVTWFPSDSCLDAWRDTWGSYCPFPELGLFSVPSEHQYWRHSCIFFLISQLSVRIYYDFHKPFTLAMLLKLFSSSWTLYKWITLRQVSFVRYSQNKSWLKWRTNFLKSSFHFDVSLCRLFRVFDL